MRPLAPWQAQSVRILVVEDDATDQELLQLAIERNGVAAELIPCLTGREALDQLENEQLPDLILLDLRLPDIDGLVLLREIKQRIEWSSIPVIVLSGSDDPTDVQSSYARQASAYLQKPTSHDGWQDLVRSFTDYWLKVVLLPRP